MKKIYFIIGFLVLFFLTLRNETAPVSIDKNFVPEISIDIPSTKYTKLNNLIQNEIEKIKSELKEKTINNNYKLNINYQKYTYYNFISYAFFIETYTGGAHPEHDIFTIVFNKENNKFIDINTLIKYNAKTLNVFSNYIRFNLIYDNRIVDVNMLLEGTLPQIDNFKNFVFSDNVIIFFEEYQIAPYSSGIISLDVPYYMIK